MYLPGHAVMSPVLVPFAPFNKLEKPVVGWLMLDKCATNAADAPVLRVIKSYVNKVVSVAAV